MFKTAFLLEDNDALVTAIRIGLQQQGVRVDAAGTLADARARLPTLDPDVLLVDLMLPDGNGLELVRDARRRSATLPIVILTGLHDEKHVVEGLATGADLYLKKPFSQAELTAHLEALSRRVELAETSLSWAGIEADLLNRRVVFGGEEARLTDVETRLLAAMVRAEGDVVERDQLLRDVWNLNFDPGTGLLHSHIRNLRRRLRPLGIEGWIEAVRGRGYRVTPTTDA